MLSCLSDPDSEIKPSVVEEGVFEDAKSKVGILGTSPSFSSLTHSLQCFRVAK